MTFVLPTVLALTKKKRKKKKKLNPEELFREFRGKLTKIDRTIGRRIKVVKKINQID